MGLNVSRPATPPAALHAGTDAEAPHPPVSATPDTPRPGLPHTGDRQHRTFPDGSRRPSFLKVAMSTVDLVTGDGRRVGTGNTGTVTHGMLNRQGVEVADPHCDSHMHPTDYVQHGLMPDQVIAMMDEIGVRNTTLMPIPTSLQVVKVPMGPEGEMVEGTVVTTSARPSGSGTNPCTDHNHHCSAQSYYIPRALEDKLTGVEGGRLTVDDMRKNPSVVQQIVDHSILYVDTAVNAHLHQHIQGALKRGELTQADRSRFDPMLTGFNLSDIRAGEKLLKEMCSHQGTFTGIGEITVHKELVQDMYADQKGQSSTIQPGKLKGLTNLMEMAGVLGMPVVLHCDIDDLHSQLRRNPLSDDPPAHFEGLKALFKDERLKDTKIVWAHGGGLGRFVMESAEHLDLMQGLMAECPNLNLDISWSAVADQINQSGDRFANRKRNWVEFIEQHSGRICFGSDTLAPQKAEGWAQTKNLYAGLLSNLSPQAKDNVLNGTYQRVFVDSRQGIRNLEQTVLTPHFNQTMLMDSARAEHPVSAAEVRAAIQTAQGAARAAEVAAQEAAANVPKERVNFLRNLGL